MLENSVMPQLQRDIDRDFIFQQDGAPPSLHFHCEGTSYLNRRVGAWIERDGTIAWPPRSPYLTPLDSSVWGYFKDKVLLHGCGHDS